MSIQGISSGSASMTVLSQANKEPKLALDLIQQTIAGMNTGATQSPTAPMPAPQAAAQDSGSRGQSINIYA